MRRDSLWRRLLTGSLLLALAVAPAAGAAAPAELTFRTVRVGSPGNPAVSIVPFSDAIYPSPAPAGSRPTTTGSAA